MANLQVGDRVLITFNTIAFNQRLMNMFVYGCSSLTGPATQQAAFAALHTALTAGGGLVPLFRACMTDQFEVTSVWYQIISPSRYAKYTKTTGLGLGDNHDGERVLSQPGRSHPAPGRPGNPEQRLNAARASGAIVRVPGQRRDRLNG